jgi:hypothetical protein
MAPVSRKTLDWIMLLCGDLTVPAVISWERHAGEATTTVALLIGFFSLVVLNVVIVRAILSHRKRLGEGTSRGFILGAVGLALLAGLLTSVGVSSFPERNEYVELALSNVPLSEIHPEQKALVVELARRRAANSKKYEQVAAQTKPISPPLYTPDSFASDTVIRAAIEQYTADYAADLNYREEEKQSMNEFRNKMMKVDPDYLKSFEVAQQSRETREEAAFQLEQECVTATLALYNYADIHKKEISIRNGELSFANDGVRIDFSRQLEESKALYERWQGALQELIREQQRSRKEIGLEPNS